MSSTSQGGAYRPIAIHYRNIFNIILLHQLYCFSYGLSRIKSDQFLFCITAVDNIFKRFYIHKATFHHPLIIIYFSNITTTMIMKNTNHQIIFF